ncbi:glyoxalase [Ruegeria sp. ANG-R]|uniref:VOC family protein n=1 Tax=Ruegeria sp. ANG-R TaxID=1577903 RepID=UPI00057F5EE2|nr:VOC family protein [Ruegeria sp. ANG-R]KIC41350.1 glyoxalase [Ruegeria sp. ANG-R]
MAPITRIILYTKRLDELVQFYETHFGFSAERRAGDRIVELVPETGGAHLLLHPAGKAAREGQAAVKLVFDVADVPAFCDRARENGLELGPIHQADGYQFANAKDPSKNSISISSRAFADHF